MSERPEQRPEGRLIAVALKRSRLSARKAADRAGLSEGRWRAIVSGYQTVSAGVYAPVRGPAETVARMALVVGATAEELRQAGREDAAEELDSLMRVSPTEAKGDDGLTSEEEELIERIRRDPAKRERLLRAILAGHGHLPPSTDSEEGDSAGHRAS